MRTKKKERRKVDEKRASTRKWREEGNKRYCLVISRLPVCTIS